MATVLCEKCEERRGLVRQRLLLLFRLRRPSRLLQAPSLRRQHRLFLPLHPLPRYGMIQHMAFPLHPRLPPSLPLLPPPFRRLLCGTTRHMVSPLHLLFNLPLRLLLPQARDQAVSPACSLLFSRAAKEVQIGRLRRKARIPCLVSDIAKQSYPETVAHRQSAPLSLHSPLVNSLHPAQPPTAPPPSLPTSLPTL